MAIPLNFSVLVSEGIDSLRVALLKETDTDVQHFILDRYINKLKEVALEVERVKGDVAHATDVRKHLGFKRILRTKIRKLIGTELDVVITEAIPEEDQRVYFWPYFDQSVDNAIQQFQSKGLTTLRNSTYLLRWDAPNAWSLPYMSVDTPMGEIRIGGATMRVPALLLAACYDQMVMEIRESGSELGVNL